jgi:hypothetical protein
MPFDLPASSTVPPHFRSDRNKKTLSDLLSCFPSKNTLFGSPKIPAKMLPKDKSAGAENAGIPFVLGITSLVVYYFAVRRGIESEG